MLQGSSTEGKMPASGPCSEATEVRSTTLRDRWRPSRFTIARPTGDGELVLFNSYSGALARVSASHAGTVRAALRSSILPFPAGPLAELALHGFFVPADVDELAEVGTLHVKALDEDNVLQLILLSSEACNFRCTYCYESFTRGRMKRHVIEGVDALVRSRAEHLRRLRIGWFGGEPLTAPRVIEEVSARLQQICRDHGIDYVSSMTTNGYLLTSAVVDMLLKSEVRRYQVTLDGLREHHDRVRMLADRKTGTFDRIIDNLLAMGRRKDTFDVVLRVNISPSNLAAMPRFLDEMAQTLGGDDRFSLDFHPVGDWGGPHRLPMQLFHPEQGQHNAFQLQEEAVHRGFPARSVESRLAPYGSVCYAANPHSFVIGSDGRVYKCTVAFDDPRNQVGWLTEGGELRLEEKKFADWVESGIHTSSVCRHCKLLPACHNNACPLARINHGGAPQCPSVAKLMDRNLGLLAAAEGDRVAAPSQ